MSEKLYLGITLGPIGDTLALADGPGGLWCASALFSDLSYRLCKKIKAIWENADFITPAFGDVTITDGSSFPDRIIVSLLAESKEAVKGKLAELKEKALSELAQDLEKTVPALKKNDMPSLEQFLKEYFQVNYVVAPEAEATKDGKNCILNLSPILDHLECASPVVADCTKHPLLTLFNSKTAGKVARNTYVRGCYLMEKEGFNGKQLLNKNNDVYSIEELAAAGSAVEGSKNRNYFAVLYADGDRMGKLQEKLPNDADVAVFSQACRGYNKAASQLVADFGGATIYAGGDDLLCLLPLKGKDGGSVLDFCSKLTNIFEIHIASMYDKALNAQKHATQDPEPTQNDPDPAATKETSNPDRPSLSIGVSINFCRFPLYEALNDAYSMLSRVAKHTRCATAISVRKASGQAFGLILPNRKHRTAEGTYVYADKVMEALPHLLSKSWSKLAMILEYKKEEACKAYSAQTDETQANHTMPTSTEGSIITDKDISQTLHSLLYAMHNFHFGFNLCSSKNIPTQELFKNFFDSSTHNANRHYINLIQKICEEQRIHTPFRAILGNKYSLAKETQDFYSDQFYDCMEAILRFAKFYCEEAGK